MIERPVEDVVAAGARAHPGRIALDDGGAALSYRDLDAAANRLARRLVTLGVKPGDAVAMLAPAGPGAVAAMYAAPRAGAALAPLSPALGRHEMRDALAAVRPAVVLCDPAHLELALDLVGAAGGGGKSRVFCLGSRDAAAGDRRPGAGHPATDDIRGVAPCDEPLPGPTPDDVVAILRTSGTGGRSRAVALTRRNFRASARAVRARLELGPQDAWHASLSLAHIGGMALVDRALAAGSRVVTRGEWRLEALAELLEAGAVSHVSLVPTMLGRLLDAGLPHPFSASLRCVLVGGAGAPPRLVERALSGGLPLALTYGMTEACSQVATAPPALVRAKPGTTGAPLDGVEVRVAAAGEIEVRGDMVARAYHRGGPIAGPHGWHRTGDLGRLDQDGHLWVTGRKARRIVSGGVNVHPAEVERVLAAHPAVAEAAVVGLPDPEWGERVAAVIVPSVARELHVEAIHRHCRELLGPAARPRALLVLAELPRNPNGKIDRTRLAARLSGTTPP
ncbi:MAG: class I adenylate-forming enzyme family protein [Gammaproteobacteria bacterium]|nr:class I adenylate-forming enzyme family protein [Gammaproteobacteria bacterium]